MGMLPPGSANVASNAFYDVEVGDVSKFAITATRGSSITLPGLSGGATNQIDLAAGLYQITFNGWVQTNAQVTGSLDYQLKISTDPAFGTSNVAFDRNIQFFGTSASVQPIIDPSHSVMFNTQNPTAIYIRIHCTTGNAVTWYLRGDAASQLTNVSVLRVSDAA
jgi:hypothetical protein